MKLFYVRSVGTVAAMALLTACGGSVPADDGHATTAALMVQVNGPVADCEAEGCNRPRIIDGLAEQYRAGAIEQQARPAEAVASQPGAALDQPAAAANPPQDTPSAARPAAAVQAQ